MTQGRMTDPRAVLAFMTAGKATLTLQNAETGNRFTYRVKFAPKRTESDPDTWFVQLLNGPDNTKNFIYIGILRKEKNVLQYIWTSRARVGRETPSVKAFQWALGCFVKDSIPASLEVYHAGKCGRCGRKLTVPESITSGFGPECINLVGFAPVSQIVAAGVASEQKNLNFPAAGHVSKNHGKSVKMSGTAAAQALYAPAQGMSKLERMTKFRDLNDDAGDGKFLALSEEAGFSIDDWRWFSEQEAKSQRSAPTPVGAMTTADGGSFLDTPQPEHSVEVAISRRIAEYKANSPENYYHDGELTDAEAYKIAYNKFKHELVAR